MDKISSVSSSARAKRFRELGGDWKALEVSAKEHGVTAKHLKKHLVRLGIEVPDGRKPESVDCSELGCFEIASSRGLCPKHYRRFMRSIRPDPSPTTPNINAEWTIRHGGRPQPQISLPYRHLAKTCPGCGVLRTTPDHLIRKSSGVLPRCPKCASAKVSRRHKERRATDDDYASRKAALASQAAVRLVGRLQAETLPKATSHRKEWTGFELEMVTRTDLTVREIALMLGRTFAATATARHRALNDPRFIQVAGGGIVRG